jgi:glutamate-1-semialdehyde 2,1-aminomutase
MINRNRLTEVRAAEEARFRESNPKSAEAAEDRAFGWHQGVPFHWMRDWPSPFPLTAAHAHGATLTTLDGDVLDDFCLGDTAAMFGHSPEALTHALALQAGQGLSYMLPSAKAAEVGALLAGRFHLPHWQLTTSASEANRSVIRWARAITGRDKILVFNGCYHGAVDDVFVDLRNGHPETRRSLVGQVWDVRKHTIAIEFNDGRALEAALDRPGFLALMREATARTGTILIWDETHTISSGLGGHSGTFGPAGDMFVIGKSIGGGVPCAAFGFSDLVAQQMETARAKLPPGHSGIGTTLSANALTIAAMYAMLDDVMSPTAYAHMIGLAQQLAGRIEGLIERHRLDWHVSSAGARVEFICSDHLPANGSEARAAMDPELEGLIHLMLVNRGTLLAPFHNMMLVSPVTSMHQVEHLVANLDAALCALE